MALSSNKIQARPVPVKWESDSTQVHGLWFGDGEPQGEAFEGLMAAGLRRVGQRDGGGSVIAGGIHAWLKGGRLTKKSARRHALREALFGRPFPRLSEAANLTWLGAHGLRAVRPLLAGLVTLPGGRPAAQFLATEFVPDAVALETLSGAERYRDAYASALALVHAMHALGFEHRDCYARNFLITRTNEAIAIDTWRGGPRRRLSRRAIARDLADFEAG
jgi:hypothetical protein